MEESKKKGILHSPKFIRNICIMAHVDHGKTTMADALVASNGIITQRQAGKIRYMDSRKDEIERGITMKSSCVTLTYQGKEGVYVINLIDSPGHVDFSSEVSTAVRLCDGTIIVVDVVEGVCAQTKVVLRQAWIEGIRPVLVLNKIDRLILEMKFSPVDAYYHLIKILEQVNAHMGELYNMDVLGRVAEEAEQKKKLSRDRKLSENQFTNNVFSDWYVNDDVDDTDLYFSPERGNVIFASAYDGWGFKLEQFAEKFHKKFGLDKEKLKESLWGDFYITSKGGEKLIISGAREKGKNPLFVSLILDNIYKIYEATMIRKDFCEIEKIGLSLGIKVPISIIKSSEPRVKLSFILSNWLPLSISVLEMVVEHLPGASEITEERARKLMCTATQPFDSLPKETQILKDFFVKCSSDMESPLIVFVSKMFGVDKASFTKRIREKTVTNNSNGGKIGLVSDQEIEARRMEIKNKIESLSIEDNVLQKEQCINNEDEIIEEEECLIAFARVFSGTLSIGQKVYVLGPKHNPHEILLHSDDNGKLSEKYLQTAEHIHVSEVKEIFLLMGRHLEPVKTAPAGSVIGIGGLEGILKSATLSSTPYCSPFTELTHQATPILKVAVEPADPKDLAKLRKGLKILNQADPCVQVLFKSSGEYVLLTAGEVHLQRCIQDLKERYAKIDITVSPPIVPFRETIIPPPTIDRLNEAIIGENAYVDKAEEKKLGCVDIHNSLGSLKVKAVPLPATVTNLLEKNSYLLKLIVSMSSLSETYKASITEENTLNSTEVIDSLSTKLTENSMKPVIDNFKSQLKAAFDEAGDFWNDAINHIWSFGPNFTGCNVLLNRVKSYNRPSIWDWEMNSDSVDSPLFQFDTNFVTGFQMATSAGPLCEEPLMGVCFIVEDWTIHETCLSAASNYTFQVISLTKDALRKSLENSHQRLMCAMYSCSISVTSEVIGKLYNLLGKRLGRVIDGDITEGSTSWNVTAYLPVVESFNFANDLRKSTSGEAMPQLVFSHWEILDIDPFWEPQTVEELTHYGEKADSGNLARKYINAVRKRKGLHTEDKIVEFAEKQRNLSKNK